MIFKGFSEAVVLDLEQKPDCCTMIQTVLVSEIRLAFIV